MNKFMGAVLAVAVLLPAGWVTASAFDDGSGGIGTTTEASTGAGTTTGETSTAKTTTSTTGTTTSTAETTTQATTVATQRGVGGATIDISGPCDEAEHANDPRCTGAPAVGDDRGRDDHRGRGRGRDDRGADDHGRRGRGGDDGDEDRSGSNSGRG